MVTRVLHRFLHALHFGAVGGLSYILLTGLVLLAMVSPLLVQQSSASGYGVFSGTSLWNQAIPRFTAVNSGSGAIVAAAAGTYGAQLGNAIGSPVYTVELSVPSVPVQYYDCDSSGLAGLIDADWSEVPIPCYAQAGTGGALTVYQPMTQTLWEFSGIQKIAGQWQACHGGKISGIGSSDGVFPVSFGAQTSGLAYLAGQVSVAELQMGQIGHVMGLYLPQVGSGSIVPAHSVGGGGDLRPGQRLQLDPLLNVADLGLSPTATLIAKAAQRYGFIVWGTAPNVAVAAESPLSATSHGAPNPYATMSTSLAGFPWDKIRSLPANFSQSIAHVPYITNFTAAAMTVNYTEQTLLTWVANDVDECSIPGIVSHAAATGQVYTTPLVTNTVFTLSCSGPDGSVSRQASVTVGGGQGANDTKPAITETVITPPLRGEAGVIPDLANLDPSPVYKVAYYEKESLVHTTTKEPFVLDTTNLIDGDHTLRIHVFYSDGHDDYRQVSMHVRNTFVPLGLAGQAYSGKIVDTIPPLLLASMGVGIAVCMIGAATTGWRWSHPDRLRQPHRRLDRYY